MEESRSYEPDSALKYVLGAVGLVVVVFGFLAYWRYASSEGYVAEGIPHMEAVGGELDVEGCVDEVVAWHDECDQHETNAAVCLQAVKVHMFHCLSQKDRAEACEADFPEEREDGKWVYDQCAERGTACKIKRECACAESYRATDSFCRNNQEGVQL